MLLSCTCTHTATHTHTLIHYMKCLHYSTEQHSTHSIVYCSTERYGSHKCNDIWYCIIQMRSLSLSIYIYLSIYLSLYIYIYTHYNIHRTCIIHALSLCLASLCQHHYDVVQELHSLSHEISAFLDTGSGNLHWYESLGA